MKTIAIVEDNEDNMLLARTMLQGHYKLHEYINGEEALRGIPANVPDVVLMDISLPDTDGTTVMQQLRENRALEGLPFIALTAHAMRGDRERFLAAGFDFYISKPVIDSAILFEAIEQFVGERDQFIK